MKTRIKKTRIKKTRIKKTRIYLENIDCYVILSESEESY